MRRHELGLTLSLAGILAIPVLAIGKEASIVPGKRIGHIEIGMSQSAVEHTLGKPDKTRRLSDGVMIETWLGRQPVSQQTMDEKGLKRHYVSVFFRQQHVAQIEASSPDFAAPGGLTTDSEASAWQRHYPPTHSFTYTWSATNPNADSPAGKHILLYQDDTKLGLAWKRGAWGGLSPDPGPKPEAIIIHPAGSKVRLNPNDADDYSGTGHHGSAS